MNAALQKNEEAGKPLTELAYERLLKMILGGTLGAGTLLHELALARELDISRTPVREALVRLEAEGLVARHAGRALVVREAPIREFMEVLRVRSILESEAVGTACASIPEATLADLRRTFEDMLARNAPDAEDHMRADDALHDAILDACGNSVLSELARGLRRRTRIFNFKSIPDRFIPGCREHLEIVGALEKRDEAAARAALKSHFENLRQSIFEKLGAI
jgi:DNA-binding GntR family transcriptional regulator